MIFLINLQGLGTDHSEVVTQVENFRFWFVKSCPPMKIGEIWVPAPMIGKMWVAQSYILLQTLLHVFHGLIYATVVFGSLLFSRIWNIGKI